MKMVLKSPTEASYEAGNDFSVFISYDDSDSAERASELLQLIGRKLKGEDGRIFHQWWNIEVLAFNSLREMAAAEAAAADMIIVGSRAGRELPDVFNAWIKRLIALRKNRPGALVAVVNPDLKKPGSAPGIFSHLKQVAALAQMDFFATGAEVGRDAGLTRRISESVRQFVKVLKGGAPGGLPGAGRPSAETCET